MIHQGSKMFKPIFLNDEHLGGVNDGFSVPITTVRGESIQQLPQNRHVSISRKQIEYGGEL